MREYDIITMFRLIRVIIRLGVSLREIGFSDDAILEITEVCAKETKRIVFERDWISLDYLKEQEPRNKGIRTLSNRAGYAVGALLTNAGIGLSQIRKNDAW